MYNFETQFNSTIYNSEKLFSTIGLNMNNMKIYHQDCLKLPYKPRLNRKQLIDII